MRPHREPGIRRDASGRIHAYVRAGGQLRFRRFPVNTPLEFTDLLRQRLRGEPRNRRHLVYQPSDARPSTPLDAPSAIIGLSRRCASTPSSNARLSRLSTPRL